jgi:tetratricopeptide (TPR) repeat protein
MVFDEQRNPVREVQVELLNDFNSVIQRTKTDGSGRFVFRALSWGRFVIRVLPLGTNFEEQTLDVEISGVGADGRPIADNLQVDIRLQRRRSGGDVDQVTGVLFAQDVPPEAKKSYETAVLDLDSNRPDAGKTELENAIKVFPKYYAALIKLGLFYIGQQKFENAIEALTRAVNVNERSFTGWYGLGYSAYSLNKPEAAIIAAQNALELEKNSINALFILGLAQRQLKKYEAAEKSLIQAKKLDKGKTSEINWNLALLYAHNLKRYSDAANELETYLKIDPEAPNKEAVKKLIKQFREKPPASN